MVPNTKVNLLNCAVIYGWIHALRMMNVPVAVCKIELEASINIGRFHLLIYSFILVKSDNRPPFGSNFHRQFLTFPVSEINL